MLPVETPILFIWVCNELVLKTILFTCVWIVPVLKAKETRVLLTLTPLETNKLRTEIDSRRKEKGGILTESSKGSGQKMLPKDVFLNTLLTSLHTGQNNPLTSNMKSLNERAEIVTNSIKKGVVTPEAINRIKELKNNAVSAPPYQPPQYNEQYQLLILQKM